MDRLENKFSIKRVTKSTDDGYLEALKIYNETTPVDIKTNTNEITEWLDTSTPSTKFELIIFVLYLDDKVTGFAMLSYLRGRKILIHDYLQLQDMYRLNVTFFAYISLIYSYFKEKSYDINFYVTEISNKNNGVEIEKESLLFRKLLCLEEFGLADAPYQTLSLGLNHHESSYDAWIYVKKSGDTISSMAKETYINIIKGIYFDYYETWYTPLLDTSGLDTFRKDIQLILKKIEDLISDIEFINIITGGSKQISANDDTIQELTSGNLPAISGELKKTFPFLALVLLILIITIIVTVVYHRVLEFFEIPITSVNSFIGSVFTGISAIGVAFFVHKKNG